MPEEMFLIIEEVKEREVPKGKGCFDTDLCTKCGERVFVDKLKSTDKGLFCIPCREE